MFYKIDVRKMINKKIMISEEIDEIIKELFKLFLTNY